MESPSSAVCPFAGKLRPGARYVSSVANRLTRASKFAGRNDPGFYRGELPRCGLDHIVVVSERDERQDQPDKVRHRRSVARFCLA